MRRESKRRVGNEKEGRIGFQTERQFKWLDRNQKEGGGNRKYKERTSWGTRRNRKSEVSPVKGRKSPYQETLRHKRRKK